MKPYYQDDWVTIYNSDCAEVVLGGADLVITDPPYGMNFVSNHRNVKHSAIHGDSVLACGNHPKMGAYRLKSGLCVLQVG